MIIPFDQIDSSKRRFYAIDSSYNSEQFYNGLSVGIYTGGYVCFHEGKQIRMNLLDDPVILGKAYCAYAKAVGAELQIQFVS